MGQTISYESAEYTLDLGDKGKILGLQFDDKARRYAGVAYALPPTGEHRWRKPRPLPSGFCYRNEDGAAYNATRFRSVCPQKAFHVNDIDGDAVPNSEDCLFVNIWTPVEKAGVKGKKWPVKLWLHGGWFQMGDPSQEPGMDATELVSTGGLDAIVVSIGYRLNVFGFLACKALLEESEGESAGNFGLWDQRLAIEWVKESIGFFGGDADNITLAGRSAGAYSVEAQVFYDFKLSPEATRKENLPFHRAFMCSNAIPAQPKSLGVVEEQFEELCIFFHISDSLSGRERLQQLRTVSAGDLVEALAKLKNHTFRPVTDNLFIHPNMFEYIQGGEFAEVFKRRHFKLLIGEVLNEETLYSTYNSPEEPTLTALKHQISNYYAPETTERVLKHYKLPESDNLQEWKKTFGQLISDGQVRAPSRVLAKALVDHGVPIRDVWRYQIAYRLSFINEKVADMSYGVAHAMDKPIWNFSITHGPTEKERAFMQDWIRILVALVQDDSSYDFGTTTVDQFKVATPDASIEIRSDPRWDELVTLGQIFGKAVDT
ncbi:alpha/beta-hydrolase [Thozetella sp. PMI_491]|nr:alpha/beta-hydrolase [Thozetella sp. PMI_491]